MVDLSAHTKGIQAALNKMPKSCDDPRAEFATMLRAEGFMVKGHILVGQLVRLDGADDKRGKNSAWYIYNEIEDTYSSGHVIGVASYGDWKMDISKSWCSRSEQQMTNPEERAAFNEKHRKMREQYEQEAAQRQDEAAQKAFYVWNNAKPADNNHPYLTSKSVKIVDGIKVTDNNRIIIPIAYNNKISSLQYISESGEKRFLTGGRLKGGWFIIEGSEDTVYIAEGYSTAHSIYQATGSTVYIAFNAGNLYEVASYVKGIYSSRIIIAGDDDTESKKNVGREKAEHAADSLGLECIFPSGFNDFNDMHKELGLKALKKYLTSEGVHKLDKIKKEDIPKDDSNNPPRGLLTDIVDYYHATSGNRQEGFAIQTALALCSIVLARSYRTDMNNYSSLYFINVGKSATGKEHPKTVIEDILRDAELGHLMGGDGYTSGGAVFSQLLDRPDHITIIDEFGRYLEAGKDMKGGNHHQREANTKLMEAFGRTHSIMRPPTYSSMTLKKDAAKEVKNRYVHNPAISIVGMTTPSTLFKTLDMGAIEDGFFNRFLVSISDAKRAVRRHKPRVDVPDKILSWISDVRRRNPAAHISTEPAAPIVLYFTDEAMQEQLDFQMYCIDRANYLDKFGMAELTGRSNEIAMRISLIVALSKNPMAVNIEKEDIQWAVQYVKARLEETIEKLKITISHSGFEHDKKEVLAAIREAAPDGITWANMQKNAPYSRYKTKDLKEILQALKDAELVIDETYVHPSGGRPSVKWTALK